MKPSQIILFIIFICFISCKSYEYTFINSTKESLAITNKTIGNYLGTVNPEDSIKTRSIGSVTFTGVNDDFHGSISFTLASPNSENSLYVLQKENAELIEVGSPNSTNPLENYKIQFGGSVISSPKITDSYGFIELTANQDDVKVYLDNDLLGIINKDQALSKRTPAGKHLIMVKKDYFMPISISMEMIDKEVFEYAFNLESASGYKEDVAQQATTRQAKGDLVIVSEKTDYNIIIKELGLYREPPLELKELPAGKYSVKIICPDFTKEIEVVVPDEGKEFIDLDVLYPRE